MSLNRALQQMLRQKGRPVRYREDNRVAVTTALLTPCTGPSASFHAETFGVPEENRFVYISASPDRPPAPGTRVVSGGSAYLVERSGAVRVDGALEYAWALLVRCGEAEE